MSSSLIPPPPPTQPPPPQRLRSVYRLMKKVSPTTSLRSTKVTVVGAGQVGMAATFSLLTMGVCSELALVDVRKDVVQGEKMDLLHGQAFMGRRCNIEADSDYAISKDSRIVVVTAGARQQEGESRLDLVQKNVGIFYSIIPEVVRYSPDAIIIVVSNPCDIMAWVTWKISGLPKHRVFATGTMLDTSRFRNLIAERFGLAAHSVHGYIIGEHGDSSVAVWSSVNIAGTQLIALTGDADADTSVDAGVHTDDAQAGDENSTEVDETDSWDEIHKRVVSAANEIIKLKGFTNWGIGLMCAKLCQTILQNQRTVLTISTMPDGWNDITDEVFISIPCVVGELGISHIVSMKLTDDELEKVKDSAAVVRNIIEGVHL